jgi:hypothetical protein
MCKLDLTLVDPTSVELLLSFFIHDVALFQFLLQQFPPGFLIPSFLSSRRSLGRLLERDRFVHTRLGLGKGVVEGTFGGSVVDWGLVRVGYFDVVSACALGREVWGYQVSVHFLVRTVIMFTPRIRNKLPSQSSFIRPPRINNLWHMYYWLSFFLFLSLSLLLLFHLESDRDRCFGEGIWGVVTFRWVEFGTLDVDRLVKTF